MSKMTSPSETEFRTILVKQDRRSGRYTSKWLMALAAGMAMALLSIMAVLCVTHMTMTYGGRPSGKSDSGEQNHARGLVFNRGFFNPNISVSGFNTPPAGLGFPTGAFGHTAMTAQQMGTGTGAHVDSTLTVAAVSAASNAECTPETVLITVTQTVSQSSLPPFTTILISDLYTNVNEITSASVPVEAAGDVTVTVSEHPTVLTTTTSTFTPDTTPTNIPEISAVTLSRVVTFTFTTSDNDGAATIATGVSTVFTTTLIGVQQTVYATGTGYSGDFNNTATESAAAATSTDLVSGGSRSTVKPTTGGGRGGSVVSSCVVMMVATLLFVF